MVSSFPTGGHTKARTIFLISKLDLATLPFKSCHSKGFPLYLGKNPPAYGGSKVTSASLCDLVSRHLLSPAHQTSVILGAQMLTLPSACSILTPDLSIQDTRPVLREPCLLVSPAWACPAAPCHMALVLFS